MGVDFSWATFAVALINGGQYSLAAGCEDGVLLQSATTPGTFGPLQDLP